MPENREVTAEELEPDLQQAEPEWKDAGEGTERPELPIPPDEPELPEDRTSKLPAFPDNWKEEFEGLTFLGYLEDVVEIPSHRFVIHTLTVGEKLQIGLTTKEFEGTLGYARAYRAAVVAAALQEVDGRPILVASKGTSVIRQKFDYVVNLWFDPIVDLLYERVNLLEARVLELMRVLGVVDAGKRSVVQISSEQAS